MKAMSEVAASPSPLAGEEGGGGGLIANFLPPQTECAIFVGPTAKELVKISTVHSAVGPGCLLILLNPRSLGWPSLGGKVNQDVFNLEVFKDVWSLQTARGSTELMQYHEHGGGYVLATRPRRSGGGGEGGDFFKDLVNKVQGGVRGGESCRGRGQTVGEGGGRGNMGEGQGGGGDVRNGGGVKRTLF